MILVRTIRYEYLTYYYIITFFSNLTITDTISFFVSLIKQSRSTQGYRSKIYSRLSFEDHPLCLFVKRKLFPRVTKAPQVWFIVVFAFVCCCDHWSERIRVCPVRASCLNSCIFTYFLVRKITVGSLAF